MTTEEIKAEHLIADTSLFGLAAMKHTAITLKAVIEEAEFWHETNSYNEATEYLGSVARIETLKQELKQLESRIKN